MNKAIFLFLFLLNVAATLLLTGCVGYRLGVPSDEAHSTVYVAPIKNDSSFPLLESSLTSMTRKAINESGILRSEDKALADVFLEVEILNFNRDIAAIQASDLGRGKKFELQMVVSLNLYEDSALQSPVFENRTFTLTQDIFADSDLQNGTVLNQVDAEHQATPELSRKISLRIAEILSETW